MDPELTEKMEAVGKQKRRFWRRSGEDKALEVALTFEQKADGTYVKLSGDKGTETHLLKTLESLYVSEKEKRLPSNPDEEEYLGLLMAIEGAISRYDQDHPDLTDRAVIRALESLGQKPEVAFDPLTEHIQRSLRLQLSLGDYSRSEVRWGIRKILASVRRHHRIDGVRGYLDFIVDYV